MKKVYKILIIVLVIVSLCISLVWWQYGNIRALYYWMKYSESDIDSLMNENSEGVKTYLEENTKYNVRPYNPVEEVLHQNGAIDDEEMVSLITEKTTIEEIFGTKLELGEDKKITIAETGEKLEAKDVVQLKQQSDSSDAVSKAPDKSTQNSNKDETTSNSETNVSEKPTQSTTDETDSRSEPENSKTENNDNSENREIAECIAQVYVVKSNFVGELDVIYNQAFSEYKALWYDMTDEQRTAKKKALLSEVYPKASSLERECDNQINQILSKLTKLLQDSGEDTNLVGQIRSSYYNEKSLKKAHYLSLLS